jgi:hypothetical protein
MRKELLFVLLILVTGCRAKLLDESVVKVELMDKEFREIDPISTDQKVNISAKATSGEFNIYVFLAKDKAEVEKEFQGKPGTKILAHQLKVTSQADLQANIPANERAIVAITSADGKKAEVKLKISN